MKRKQTKKPKQATVAFLENALKELCRGAAAQCERLEAVEGWCKSLDNSIGHVTDRIAASLDDKTARINDKAARMTDRITEGEARAKAIGDRLDKLLERLRLVGSEKDGTNQRVASAEVATAEAKKQVQRANERLDRMQHERDYNHTQWELARDEAAKLSQQLNELGVKPNGGPKVATVQVFPAGA